MAKSKTNLQFDPRNANRHNERSLAATKESLRVFKAGRSILADQTGTVVAGEATLRGARELGIPIREVHTTGDELVVVVRDDLGPEDARRRALALADNQTSNLSDFDDDALRGELAELGDDQELLNAIGFSDQELRDMLDPEPPEAAVWDEEPKTEEPAITRPGDLWTLGRHRLLCGDSTKDPDLDRLMDGEQAQLVFTDPPYGVSYQGVINADGTPSKKGGWQGIKNDNRRDDDLIQGLLLPAFRQAVRVARDDAAFYIWHASSTRKDFEFALQSAGLQERQYIIWVKPVFVLGHSDYHWGHEPAFYCHKAGHSPKWIGDRTQSTTWRVTNVPAGGTVSVANGLRITNGDGSELFVQLKAPKSKKLRLLRLRTGEHMTLTTGGCTDCWEVELDPKKDVQHPTQKPSELAARAIRNHLGRGESVLDLFGGSGSTMMGAEQMGCRAYTMELSPHYCDVQLRRYRDATGTDPVRHDGVTFNTLSPPEPK